MIDAQCPHCQKFAHVEPNEEEIGSDIDSSFGIVSYNCPACQRIVIKLVEMPKSPGFSKNMSAIYNPRYIKSEKFVYPKSISRPPAPIEVPNKFADDYREACLVLSDSPKASAALSRRCLQSIIHDELKITHNDNLYAKINDVISNNLFTSHITELLHNLRTIGNFAAHPKKDTNTGEILDVEPGEAEFCLEILEAIFDYQFVQPAQNKARKKVINQKLIAAGKPPLK